MCCAPTLFKAFSSLRARHSTFWSVASHPKLITTWATIRQLVVIFSFNFSFKSSFFFKMYLFLLLLASLVVFASVTSSATRLTDRRSSLRCFMLWLLSVFCIVFNFCLHFSRFGFSECLLLFSSFVSESLFCAKPFLLESQRP